MKITHAILTIALPLTVAACATTYQPKGFSGGYSESQLDPTTVRVTFEGNGYSRKSKGSDPLNLRGREDNRSEQHQQEGQPGMRPEPWERNTPENRKQQIDCNEINVGSMVDQWGQTRLIFTW